MFFMITPTGIYCSIIVACITLFRILYLAITNNKCYPQELFKGRFLFLFIMNFILITASVVLALFFSKDFFYNGVFFLWSTLSGICLCLYFVLWVIFWMHGYEARYQFKKVVIPAPMAFLAAFTLILTAVCTLNYYLLAASIMLAITSYLWNYKGYLLTKPKIPDYIPIPENDE